MKDEIKIRNRRIFVIYLCMLLVGIACLVKILHLKLAQGQFYKGNPQYCLDTTLPDSLMQQQPLYQDSTCDCFVVENAIKPERGEIYDANGKILAGNSCIYGFTINGSKWNSKKYKAQKKNVVGDSLRINAEKSISLSDYEGVKREIHNLAVALYKQLSDRFPQSVEYYEDKLYKAIVEHKRVFILGSLHDNLSRQITAKDISVIRKLPIINYRQSASGVRLLEIDSSFIRIYPYKELAKRTIGNVQTDGFLGYGLENSFDSVLTGTFGAKKMLEIDGIDLPLDNVTESTDGLNIHTTLDLDIQSIVYESLMNELIKLNATWGCAVVMETETGEIKAISNLSKKRYKDTCIYTEQLNYAFRSTVEPGSTFKLASLLACLDKNPKLTSQTFYLCGCGLKNKYINAHFVGCKDQDAVGAKHRLATPDEIFQRSSNEGISGMVFSSFDGKYKQFVAALDSMNITLPIKNQLEIVTPSVRRNARDNTSFYTLCFGGGIDLSPIQTLTYYNAVANNGKMVAPMFVKYYSFGYDTLAVLQPTVIKQQIAKQSTIQTAQKYLRNVVVGEYGTAKKYKNNEVAFAGKTGTRDTRDQVTKAYKTNSNNISFCGYFPYEKPKYSCIVFISDAGLTSSSEAVRVFVDIANRISKLDAKSAIPEYDFPNAKEIPAFTKVSSEAVSTVLKNMPCQPKLEQFAPGSYLSSENQKIKLANVDFNTPFDSRKLIGMNPSDAIFELRKLGFTVKIKGFGKVSEVVKKEDKSYLLILKPY